MNSPGDAGRPLRVLVVGMGNMGCSHAMAYHENPGFEIVALVNRSPRKLPGRLQAYKLETSFEMALAEARPDLVAVTTHPDSHAQYAMAAMHAGAHVFMEKPIATTVADAQQVVETARRTRRKLTVGYILRHHPSWMTLIEQARALGGPYVFRLNLNQQSSGSTWATHKGLMKSMSPIVDCGVHYVDVMCQITDARPIRVHGMGVRLSDEIAADMYNYGHFQVVFEDGSVGWYEAGWGPMISDAAHFVKDIMTPNGSVSIVIDGNSRSDDIDSHTQTSSIKIHRGETDGNGKFRHGDEVLSMKDEPGHQELCNREQAFMLRAIRQDLDLSRHMEDAVRSLRICLAADESIRTGQALTLD